ncbi:hypothetical protein WDU94_003465, partial [Cyamophila willieti]
LTLQKEKEISAQYSTFLNKAYSTLENPYERTLYLLSLHNVSITENTQSNPKLLMEVFELNDKLDEANTPEELAEMWKPIKKELHDLYV